jgi:hypothetical protein
MRQAMPEDRIIMRGREGDEARLSELLKTDQAVKMKTVTAVRTLMWRKRRQA